MELEKGNGYLGIESPSSAGPWGLGLIAAAVVFAAMLITLRKGQRHALTVAGSRAVSEQLRDDIARTFGLAKLP